MVINYLNILCSTLGPTEADAKLGIDSYAMLTFAFSFQCLKLVSRRNLQIIQAGCDLQLPELAQRNALERFEFLDPLIMRKPLGFLIFKRKDH